MSNARNLAKVAVDANGDIAAGSLDNLTGALGYTPVNKAGDTITGGLNVTGGNVGIGTSSPSQPLTVQGNAQFQGTNSFVYIDNGGVGGSALKMEVTGSTSVAIGSDSNHPLLFKTNTTERMRIDSAGRVTMPYQPAWCYNTRNNWTNNQFNLITFSSYWNISGNRYQGSYTTGLFTAPVSGIYQVNFTDVPYSGGSSSAYVQYNLFKNGASWVWLTHSEYASVRNYEPVSASCVIELAAGDTIGVGAYPSGMNNNNAGACTFSGFLIG